MNTTTAREIAELLATDNDAAIDAIATGDLALAHVTLSFELTFARSIVEAYDTDTATAEAAANGDPARYAKACEVIGAAPVLLNNLFGELANRDMVQVAW